MENKILAEKVNYFTVPGTVVFSETQLFLQESLSEAIRIFNKFTGEEVSFAEIESKSRKGKLAMVRQLYCKVVKDLYNLYKMKLAYETIGKKINISRTGVIYHIRTANNYYNTERQFKKMYDNLWGKLKK